MNINDIFAVDLSQYRSSSPESEYLPEKYKEQNHGRQDHRLTENRVGPNHLNGFTRRILLSQHIVVLESKVRGKARPLVSGDHIQYTLQS